MVFSLQRKLYFSKDPEGVQHFPWGGGDPTFVQGGPNANFYRNPYNMIFQGGGALIPPSGSANVVVRIPGQRLTNGGSYIG